MFNQHVTRNGRKMMVCEMTDSHLINTIRLLLRNLTEMVKIARESAKFNEYEQNLYNLKRISPEQAAELTKVASEDIAPYVMEAVLRDIIKPELIAEIRTAFGRSARFVKPMESNLLASGEIPTTIEEWESEVDLLKLDEE